MLGITRFILCALTCALPVQLIADPAEQKIIAIQQAKIESLKSEIQNIKSRVRGNALELQVNWCGGAIYNCSVRSCLDLCQQKGGRIAQRSEMATIALKGENHCAHAITYDSANNRFDSSYPMYNFSGGGCHNANKIPNYPLMPIDPASYDTKISANCACMVPIF